MAILIRANITIAQIYRFTCYRVFIEKKDEVKNNEFIMQVGEPQVLTAEFRLPYSFWRGISAFLFTRCRAHIVSKRILSKVVIVPSFESRRLHLPRACEVFCSLASARN